MTKFKASIHSEIYARVCGSCGYTELYAAQPLGLYYAYAEARKNEAP